MNRGLPELKAEVFADVSLHASCDVPKERWYCVYSLMWHGRTKHGVIMRGSYSLVAPVQRGTPLAERCLGDILSTNIERHSLINIGTAAPSYFLFLFYR